MTEAMQQDHATIAQESFLGTVDETISRIGIATNSEMLMMRIFIDILKPMLSMITPWAKAIMFKMRLRRKNAIDYFLIEGYLNKSIGFVDY